MIINIFCLVNIFIVFFIVLAWFVGVIIVIISMIIIVLFFFCFEISFEFNDAVYMKSVIIPEENVKITTNEIQLLIVFLNIIVVEIKDNVRIIIAILIGFVFFNIFLVIITIIMVMIPFILMIYKIIVSSNF